MTPHVVHCAASCGRYVTSARLGGNRAMGLAPWRVQASTNGLTYATCPNCVRLETLARDRAAWLLRAEPPPDERRTIPSPAPEADDDATELDLPHPAPLPLVWAGSFEDE